MFNKKILIIYLIGLFSINQIYSQNEFYKKNKIKIEKYGYIKLDTFFDTRQVFVFREGHFLLYPKRKLPDKNGKDINAHPEFGMTSIETRFGLNMSGLDFDCTKIFGNIEGDFRGTSNFTCATFRLRQAYLKLDNFDNRSILFGMYWYPLTPVECVPLTIAYSSGAPIDLQSLNPQIRFTKNINNFEINFAAASQIYYKSLGPNGDSTEYIRNGIVPDSTLVFKYYYNKHIFGVGGGLLRLVPRLVTDENIKTTEGINSFTAIAYAALNYDYSSLRTKIIFSQNGYDKSLISGYAVKTKDPETDIRTYSNVSCFSVWLDGDYKPYICDNKEVIAGLFIGWSKNLGSRSKLYIDPKTNQPIVYSIAAIPDSGPVDNVFRVSPRIVYNHNNFSIGLELELTRASFGKFNDKAKVIDKTPANNLRILLAAYYYF